LDSLCLRQQAPGGHRKSSLPDFQPPLGIGDKHFPLTAEDTNKIQLESTCSSSQKMQYLDIMKRISAAAGQAAQKLCDAGRWIRCKAFRVMHDHKYGIEIDGVETAVPSWIRAKELARQHVDDLRPTCWQKHPGLCKCEADFDRKYILAKTLLNGFQKDGGLHLPLKVAMFVKEIKPFGAPRQLLCIPCLLAGGTLLSGMERAVFFGMELPDYCGRCSEHIATAICQYSFLRSRAEGLPTGSPLQLKLRSRRMHRTNRLEPSWFLQFDLASALFHFEGGPNALTSWEVVICEVRYKGKLCFETDGVNPYHWKGSIQEFNADKEAPQDKDAQKSLEAELSAFGDDDVLSPELLDRIQAQKKRRRLAREIDHTQHLREKIAADRDAAHKASLRPKTPLLSGDGPEHPLRDDEALPDDLVGGDSEASHGSGGNMSVAIPSDLSEIDLVDTDAPHPSGPGPDPVGPAPRPTSTSPDTDPTVLPHAVRPVPDEPRSDHGTDDNMSQTSVRSQRTTWETIDVYHPETGEWLGKFYWSTGRRRLRAMCKLCGHTCEWEMTTEESSSARRTGQGRAAAAMLLWMRHGLTGLHGPTHKGTVCSAASRPARLEVRKHMENTGEYLPLIHAERPQRTPDNAEADSDYEPEIIPYP